MITSFIAENYRSIDGEIRLSFMADTGIKDMDNRGYTTVANTRVLNAKAFYGANSSGKSNVFKAVGRMRSIIIHSVRLNDKKRYLVMPFSFRIRKRDQHGLKCHLWMAPTSIHTVSVIL